VILVDANLLVYAYVPSSTQHSRARAWLDSRLTGSDAVGLPWICLLAFLRLVTSARVIERPIAAAEAYARVNTWLSNDVVWIPQPTQNHAEILARLMADMGATGNLVNDAHLATLAIEHGLTIYSADSDFARFRGVRWINPLELRR